MSNPVSRFSAGILARKPFSERWAVTVGLSLHYYSARMRIGQEVKSYIPQTASLLANPAAAPIQTYPYYSTGDDQSYQSLLFHVCPGISPNGRSIIAASCHCGGKAACHCLT